ncbi:unnamed protein product (macronuclear) [Paramecium tetraurelia]|uniref:PX domain-containing protein n=1 Tax=Paramecium tetraurelia TaxID=5888 RepID=A0BPN9_PARTE|nr:uncharacterized protein GSPATT00005256001 [Paramecium tetraurelia]CAK60506.1 unnamed protein product [Paramecium tetraurelia]|eukprot:XP_001427904.1 hypothetical protein (macronuclear) [Paramecium tetraurelia strain d4-2]
MNNIEILQKLLIEEIINKQYSQEEFEQYVQAQAPEKDDLSSWSYEDLKICIDNFQSLKKNQKLPQNQENEIYGFQNIDEKLYSVIVSNQHKIYIVQIPKLFRIISLWIPMKKLQDVNKKSILLKMMLSYNFKFHIRDSGLWSFITQKSIVVFQIQTFPMQWKVQRTLQEFAELRNIICQYFPEKIIPRFPYGGYTKLEDMLPMMEEIILSIKNLLSIYNKIPIIRTIQPCLWFVNEVNDQLLQKKLKDELQKEKRYNLQQKQTKTGEIKVSLTFDSYQKFLDQSSYPKNAINLLNQVIGNMNEFFAYQKKSQDFLGNAAQCLFELTNTLPKYPDQSGLIDYINLVNDHFNQIIYEIDDSCALLDNHLKLTFAKLLGSHKSYIRLCQNVNEIKNKFVQDHNNLNKKKDDLIKNNELKLIVQRIIQQNKFDQSEFDKLSADSDYLKSFLYVPETQQNQQLQDQLVYMIQQFSKAMDEQFRADLLKVNANFGGFLYAKQKLCQKYTEQWKELVNKYESVKSKQG